MDTILIRRPNASSLPAALRQYEKSTVRVVVAALNRTAQSAATVAIRAIQADTGARNQKTIRDAVVVYPAQQNQAEPVAEIATRGMKIPLIEFRTTPASPPRRRPKTLGVTWGPTRRLVPHSFVQSMQSGHIGVFGRIGDKRPATRGFWAGKVHKRGPLKGKPIEVQAIIELTGPSIPKVFSNRSVQAQVMAKIKERTPIEFAAAAKHFAEVGA